MAKGGIFKNKKLRPWIIGAVVLVGGIVLFVMMRRGAGGDAGGVAVSAGGPSEALQAAQLQASASITQAQLAANVEQVRLSGELEAYKYGQDTQLAVGEQQLALATYQTQAQTQIQLAGIGAQEHISMAQEATAQYGISAQAAVQQAGIASQTAIAQSQFQFLSEQQQANVQMAQISAQRDIAINQAQQKTERKKSTLGFLGSVVGGIASIFSDIGVKDDVTWTGFGEYRNPAGRGFQEYGRYSWSYRGDGSNVLSYGVIAQEVRRIAPMSVSPVRAGRHMSVDYGAIPA